MLDNLSIFITIVPILVQIGILWWILYWFWRLLKGTPGLTQLIFIFISLTLAYLLSHYLNLRVLEFIIVKLFAILPIVLTILYQTELRHVIGIIARKWQFRRLTKGNKLGSREMAEFIDAIVHSVENLSKTKTGALIAIEQYIPLTEYGLKGRKLGTPIIPYNAILETIFYKGGPLHDGGVIIRRGQVEGAACQFPLSMKEDVRLQFGMRHQAAVGLSEATDALIIVVSEENGLVHFVHKEKMEIMTDAEMLRERLRKYMITEKKPTPSK